MSTAPSPRTVRTIFHNGVPLRQLARVHPYCIRPFLSGYHHHPVTDPTGRPPTLYLYSHTPEQVAEAIEYFLPKSTDTMIQKQLEAMRTYERMRRRPVANPESANLLLQYLHIFDRLFFRGALKGLCCIEIVKELPGAVGDFTSHKNMEFNDFHRVFEGRIRILDLTNDPLYLDAKDRLQSYVETILHEALHGMFELYSCWKCGNCKSNFRNALGRFGHKGPWERSAELVEEASTMLYRGRIDLEIITSVAFG
jgi:hypothetical protein